KYYYHGQNKLLAVPQENSLDSWDPRNNIIDDEAEVMDLINKQPGNPKQFWLVDDGWCGQGNLQFNCQILQDVVDKYFEVESMREFFEPTSVRLLHRK